MTHKQDVDTALYNRIRFMKWWGGPTVRFFELAQNDSSPSLFFFQGDATMRAHVSSVAAEKLIELGLVHRDNPEETATALEPIGLSLCRGADELFNTLTGLKPNPFCDIETLDEIVFRAIVERARAGGYGFSFRETQECIEVSGPGFMATIYDDYLDVLNHEVFLAVGEKIIEEIIAEDKP